MSKGTERIIFVQIDHFGNGGGDIKEQCKHELFSGTFKHCFARYPLMDHVTVFAEKYQDQVSPYEDKKTFLVSIAYTYPEIENHLRVLGEKLMEYTLDLDFQKIKYGNAGPDAYLIIIADTGVTLIEASKYVLSLYHKS